MKKILYVVGAGLAVSAVAATFYFWNRKKKESPKNTCEYKNSNDNGAEEKDKSSTDIIIAQDETAYEDAKSSAVSSMYSRHEGTASIMRDSVDAIRENIKVSERTNNEIDDISAELDRMISED